MFDGPMPRPPLAERTCPNCGTTFAPIRRNQTCCGVPCRREYDRRERQRERQRGNTTRAECSWCFEPFAAKPGQEFCCPDHQRAHANHWKGQGPKLARALHRYRVDRSPGAFTDLCREFQDGRDAAAKKAGVTPGPRRRKGRKP